MTRLDTVLSANVNATKDQVLLLPTSADIVLARMEGKLLRADRLILPYVIEK